jgi:hypothetical protein
MAMHPGRILGRAESETGGEVERERETGGDGLAVQQLRAETGPKTR